MAEVEKDDAFISDAESGDPLDVQDDEGWEDAELDEEKITVVCLFDKEQFSDVGSMLQHCKDEHDFDMVSLKNRFALDYLGLVKLVNYVRKQVRAGFRDAVLEIPDASVFEDDLYLLPVLEDDAVLYSLEEVLASKIPEVQAEDQPQLLETSGENALSRALKLEKELKQLQQHFHDYRETVDRTLEDRWRSGDSEVKLSRATHNQDGLGTDDREYFHSYSYNEIHEIMLKDTVRTDAYRDFIYDNKSLFNGKVVLDVGCGTGILSMFCAKAGASKVIAVDNSEIIDKARENVYYNDLGDIITCLKGKVEEVSLPVPTVDIIVSEWMGYCLLYEAMLDSVIWTRDRYLAADGLMAPSHITLRIAPLTDPDYVADHISFWQSVYGFNMTSMLAHIYDEVLIRDVTIPNIPAPSKAFRQLPLHTATVQDLTFSGCPFSLEVAEDADSFDGFVIWFDTFFMRSRAAFDPQDSGAEQLAKEKGVMAFTTGPGGPQTHWRQGTLLIDYGKTQSEGLKKGSVIRGEIGYKKHGDNPRELDIEISWRVDDSPAPRKQVWFMR